MRLRIILKAFLIILFLLVLTISGSSKELRFLDDVNVTAYGNVTDVGQLSDSGNVYQDDITGDCTGQVVVSVNDDGTLNCEADDTGAGAGAENCSVAGSCESIAYLDYTNDGTLTIGGEDSDTILIMKDAGGSSRGQLGVTDDDYLSINSMHGIYFIMDNDDTSGAPEIVFGHDGTAMDNDYDALFTIESAGNYRFHRDLSFFTDTSDGSDDNFMRLCGGGSCSSSRGAIIVLGGNEDGTYPGNVVINPGISTGMAVTIDSVLTVEDGYVGFGHTDPSQMVHLGYHDNMWIFDGYLCVENSGGTNCAGTTDGYVYADDYIEHTHYWDTNKYGSALDEIMRHEGVSVNDELKPNYDTFMEDVKVTGYIFPEHLQQQYDELTMLNPLMTDKEFYDSLPQYQKNEVELRAGMSIGGRASQNEQAIKELYAEIEVLKAEIEKLKNAK